MKKGEETKRIRRQEAAMSQPRNGAVQLCLCRLQQCFKPFVQVITVGLVTVKK